MKILHITLATVATLALLGCGGGGGSTTNNPLTGGETPTANDDYLIVPATYTLNGSMLPSCPNAYSITTLKAQKEDDFGIHGCLWLCASYEGASPTAVKLNFVQQGKDSPWDFDDAVTTTAHSQCHN